MLVFIKLLNSSLFTLRSSLIELPVVCTERYEWQSVEIEDASLSIVMIAIAYSYRIRNFLTRYCETAGLFLYFGEGRMEHLILASNLKSFE